MSQQVEVLWISAVITAVIQLLGFTAAYALQTEKFYDILGGLNYLILGIYSIDGEFSGQNSWSNTRKSVCTSVFICSRSWLLIFLAWRAHERGGDSRFDEVKNKFGMFLMYWMFQAIWVFTITMPIIFVNSSDLSSNHFSAGDYVAIIGFSLGVLIEIIADIQKAFWVKKGRQGYFCQTGLWKYSRHPNYFGEILQWWCAWGFSFGSGNGIGDAQWWVGIISPLFTMQILLNTAGTGVSNANGKNLKRYYDNCADDYSEYRNSTSILIPMVGYKYVPVFLKRTIFMDFKRYEYRPSTEDSTQQATDKTQF